MISAQAQVNDSVILVTVTKGSTATIRQFATAIQQRMLISFSLPKHGRIYKRKGRTHQASARGEAPAIDTGFLSNSIKVTFPQPNIGLVRVGAEYGEILNKILDRPFVSPAITGALDDLKQGGVLGGLIGAP